MSAVQWTGSETAVIDFGTSPWIEDSRGLKLMLAMPEPGERGACGDLGHFLPGILAPINSDSGIERCDACNIYQSDLQAAQAVAESLGPGFTVWFEGKN